MKTRHIFIAAAWFGGLALSGCASQSGILQTGAITTPGATGQTAAMQPKVDPACVTLSAQIDNLRKEGVTERIEKVSAGKSKTVSVKRESLAKMTELAKADAEFQAKCSTIRPQQAQVTAAPIAAQAAVVAPATAQKAAKP